VGSDAHVVAYDFGDSSAAARLWWLLRYFGHERVSLLDGGMARWKAEGLPLESGVRSYPSSPFIAEPHPEMIVDANAVEAARRDPHTLVLDSRAVERYEGRIEPVDPVAGHIPGARNNPYASNVRGSEAPPFPEP